MKNNVRNLAVLAVFTMTLAGLALAQQFDYRVEANIPVDFYAGNQHFPAGNYRFAVDYGDRVVTMRNQTGSRSLVLLASPVEFASPGYDRRNEGTVVELNSVGGKYVLADLETRTNGVTFAEAGPGRTVAKNEGTVTVVASLR